jgi:hypothetical protein
VRKVGIHSEGALGLREVSGLTVRGGPQSRPGLLAVGDESFAVASVDIDDDGVPAQPRCADLAPALREVRIGPGCGSGFEGIACDGAGTLVLLQEEQARLLVVAPDLSRLLHAVALAVPSDDPLLNPGWHRRPNSRGEGLLLLDGGHVLIARERDDACLIEFGPPGDAPIGVSAGTVLAPAGRFRRPDAVDSDLVSLAVWPLAVPELPTVNDLARGPDGRVYALSAESRAIARLECRLVPGERARATEVWQIGDGLPGGHDARPEGLTFLPSGRPAVGIDTKHPGNNLVVLDQLDGRRCQDAGRRVM